MSNELKRVGLIFTQEGAVDFKKTLQDINLEMNKNYNQFKLTQAQWDRSTTSTQKLRVEQEYLKNAYEIQEDKVKTLKMQLSDLENAENKNITAIKKKRNELTNAEVKLENYKNKIKDIENQLNNTGKKIEEFGTKIEKTGDNIEKAGKKVSAFSAATGVALVASAKSAIDFESAFTGVEKTVDGTEQQMEQLKQGIREMAKEIPSTTTEISAVAEAAGQLGIKTEDILSFTRVMIDLGNSTNLSAEEAASSLAKFANVTKMSAKDYDKLGATIVDLGNNFATTEADIVEMATRLAATGELAGLSQAQILSLATAMSSVGIEAEAGGSAMSKLLKKIQVAVETGGSDLKEFSKIAGMTSAEFKQAFEKDAVGALSSFIGGLNDTKRNGKSAISILEDMGLTEVRLSNTVLSLANASDVMNDAVKVGNKAWENNTALTNEANKRYGTLKSQITIAVNKIKDLAITFGNKLMPTISKVIEKIEKLTKWVSNLTDEQVEFIVKIGMVVTALGPFLTILGKVTSTIGGVVKGVGTFTQAIGVMSGTITTTSTTVTGLAKVMSTLANPIGIVTIAIGSLIAAYTAHHIAVTQEKASLGGLREEVEKQNNTWKELKDTRESALSSSMSEIKTYETLVNELKQITDENGNVKQGYEDRAQTILNILNNALETEYKMTGNVISQYQELKNNIDKVIASKKAEAMLNAYQEEYATAIKEQANATNTLVGLKQKLAEAAHNMANGNARERKEAELQYSSIARQIGEQTQLISEYGYTIQNYEKLQAASVKGSANEIDEAINQIGVSYDTLKQKTEQSIEQQVINQAEYVKMLKESWQEAVNNNDTFQAQILNSQLETQQQELANLTNSLVQQTSTIQELTPNQIEAWKYIANQSFMEYSQGLSKLPPETQKKIQEATGIIAIDTELETEAGKEGNQATMLFSENLKLSDEAKEEIDSTASTINNDVKVNNATKELAKKADTGFNNNINASEWGYDLTDELSRGMLLRKAKEKVTTAASTVAGWVSSYLHFSLPEKGPLSDMDKSMPDMIDLMAKGIDNSKSKLINSASKLASEVNEELNDINGNDISENKKEITAHTQIVKNYFYNPTFTIPCDNVNEKSLDTIFNYVNNRLGKQW